MSPEKRTARRGHGQARDRRTPAPPMVVLIILSGQRAYRYAIGENDSQEAELRALNARADRMIAADPERSP